MEYALKTNALTKVYHGKYAVSKVTMNAVSYTHLEKEEEYEIFYDTDGGGAVYGNPGRMRRREDRGRL